MACKILMARKNQRGRPLRVHPDDFVFAVLESVESWVRVGNRRGDFPGGLVIVRVRDADVAEVRAVCRGQQFRLLEDDDPAIKAAFDQDHGAEVSIATLIAKRRVRLNRV